MLKQPDPGRHRHRRPRRPAVLLHERSFVEAQPADYTRFVRRKLDEYVYPQLRQEPFFGANIKKLRGYSPDIWRYRIGKFRLFYVVDGEERIVCILSIDFRPDAYR